MNSNRPPRAKAASLALLGFAITLSGCSGMAGLQDLHYSCVNRTRASAAWRERHDAEQRRCLGHDYEAGFKAGYFDTSTGKDCRTPATPPPKYWSTRYQCCDGQVAIQNWFKGYQCGMTAAESAGFSEFHDIPVSVNAPVLNKTACGTCYSSDPCNCQDAASPPVYNWLPEAMPVDHAMEKSASDIIETADSRLYDVHTASALIE